METKRAWIGSFSVVEEGVQRKHGTIGATAIIIRVTTGKQLDSCHSLCHRWVLQTAERVFSLLNNQFNQRQTRTLSDLIFLSLFLSYNKRR